MTFARATAALLLCLVVFAARPSVAVVNIEIYSDTPISDAASQGNVHDLEDALLKGTDPNSGDRNGTPAIIFAAVGGHDGVIKVLLEHGARVDAADKYGNTALLEAAARGHAETVRTLLAAGAKADWQNKAGETALIQAVRAGQAAAVAALIDGKADVNATDYTGRTALSYATEGRSPRVTSLLQKAGAKP
jgi:hypothetical protein